MKIVSSDLARLIAIAVVIFFLIGIVTSGRFFSAANFLSMAFQFPELGVFALAITLSLITGGIDLSIVSTANLSGILAAFILVYGIPGQPSSGEMIIYISMAVVVALATGVLCGCVNGILIAKMGITPILATLGTMQLFLGIAYVVTRGPAVAGFPSAFLTLGNGTLLGVPVPLLIFLLLAGVTAVLLNRTKFGLWLFLMGTNEVAARFSGIPVAGMLIRTYALTGLLSGCAGIMMMAHANSAKADYGSSYLLQALLVAILAGVDPKGGYGRVAGVIIAVVTLQALSSMFNMLRFSNFLKEFVWGGFLLLIMATNHLSRKHRRRAAAG